MSQKYSFQDLRKTIGINIQHRRRLRGMTLIAMSRQTGISVRKLDCYEMGKCAFHLEVLFHISCALHTKMNELFLPLPVNA